MILLTLLCLSIHFRTSTLAIPTGRPSLPPAVANSQSILIRDGTPSETRTIWNIIWSCLSTLFACAWIAVHPNIPAPGDSEWKIFRRRLMIMTYVLLAPELVIIWAARQHRDANVLAEKFQIEGRSGWTRTHAFFLIMGGFTLHANGRPLRVLEWRDIQALAGAGRIAWPDITEEEINDRSKGDYLSKGIVVLQTTWFIVQFFARVASKLAITELEVVTLAFSTLIGVIYYLWWYKPLDVRCSIPVYLVELDTEQATSDEDFSPKDFCLHSPLPLDISLTMAEEEAAVEGGEIGTGNQCMSFPPDFPRPPPRVLDKSRFDSIRAMIKDSPPRPPPPPPPQTDFPQTPTSDVSWMKRFHLLIQSSCQERGTPAGLIHVFIFLPANFFLGAQFDAMVTECNLETDTREPNDQPSDALLRNGPLHVPTFYSSSIGGFRVRFLFGGCVSIFFGVIHCFAWHDEFPSSPERWGWRILAIIISVVPLMLLSLFTVYRMGFIKESSAIFAILRECSAWLYMTSRIALRALPSGAYTDLDWATILPHI